MMIGLIKPGVMGPRWVWEKATRSAERAAHTLPDPAFWKQNQT